MESMRSMVMKPLGIEINQSTPLDATHAVQMPLPMPVFGDLLRTAVPHRLQETEKRKMESISNTETARKVVVLDERDIFEIRCSTCGIKPLDPNNQPDPSEVMWNKPLRGQYVKALATKASRRKTERLAAEVKSEADQSPSLYVDYYEAHKLNHDNNVLVFQHQISENRYVANLPGPLKIKGTANELMFRLLMNTEVVLAIVVTQDLCNQCWKQIANCSCQLKSIYKFYKDKVTIRTKILDPALRKVMCVYLTDVTSLYRSVTLNTHVQILLRAGVQSVVVTSPEQVIPHIPEKITPTAAVRGRVYRAATPPTVQTIFGLKGDATIASNQSIAENQASCNPVLTVADPIDSELPEDLSSLVAKYRPEFRTSFRNPRATAVAPVTVLHLQSRPTTTQTVLETTQLLPKVATLHVSKEPPFVGAGPSVEPRTQQRVEVVDADDPALADTLVDLEEMPVLTDADLAEISQLQFGADTESGSPTTNL
jgi:hypothetical protein